MRIIGCVPLGVKYLATITITDEDWDVNQLEEGRRWQGVFETGEQVENNVEEREIVTSRLDATMIHSQEKGERNIVVKLYLKGEEKLP